MCAWRKNCFINQEAKNKAIESLKLLSNQTHFQNSGVCIYKNNDCIWEYSETVELKMHDLVKLRLKIMLKWKIQSMQQEHINLNH